MAQPKAETLRTHGGQDEMNTRWTHGGLMPDKVWRHGSGGHMPDKFGDADTMQTHGKQAPGTRPEHIAASLFFLRENPTVNCLGKKDVVERNRK